MVNTLINSEVSTHLTHGPIAGNPTMDQAIRARPKVPHLPLLEHHNRTAHENIPTLSLLEVHDLHYVLPTRLVEATARHIGTSATVTIDRSQQTPKSLDGLLSFGLIHVFRLLGWG